MKKVPLALALVGLVFLAIGIVIAFANPLSSQSSNTISCSGTIIYSSGESEPTESNSEIHVDARGYIPIIVSVGLLSIAFLDGIVKKKHK